MSEPRIVRLLWESNRIKMKNTILKKGSGYVVFGEDKMRENG